ncbi:MAG: patatin-like phospholipase family protein [Planctomycetota bacterium]
MRIGLCLSGGGFRATLFHLGALTRLNELGVLSKIETFSSVSGGSITNAVLAQQWRQLERSDEVFSNLDQLVCEPIRNMCRLDLRTSVIADWINPLDVVEKLKLFSKDYSLTDLLAKFYRENLGLDCQLNQLTDNPEFIFCATNLESGVNWEFQSGEQGKMGDYVVGYTRNDETLDRAVAASSSFTPLFPPIIVKRDHSEFSQGSNPLLSSEKNRIALTDGGIYDNFGMEPLWNLDEPKYDYVLVSDAGRPTHFVDEPSQQLIGRLGRSFDIALGQVANVRKRWLIREFIKRGVKGTYWGLNSNHKSYNLEGSQGFGYQAVNVLNRVRTDLDSFTDGEQACLINHGYAITDTAIRRWCPELVAASSSFEFPFPEFGSDDAALDQLKESSKRTVMKDFLNFVLARLGI